MTDDTIIKIVYLNSKNIDNNSISTGTVGTMSNEIEEGGGGAILYVTYQGVTKVFNVTAHALQRITERFNGNWATVEEILTKGDIYKDVANGGYAIYKASNSLALTDDLLTIKTAMDNVSIWDKLASSVWKILGYIISIW